MYCLMVAYLGGCIEVKDIWNQYAIPNAETLLDINDLYRKMQKGGTVVLSTIQELDLSIFKLTKANLYQCCGTGTLKIVMCLLSEE